MGGGSRSISKGGLNPLDPPLEYMTMLNSTSVMIDIYKLLSVQSDNV